MKSVVKKGHVAYDLGANNGLHGLLLATLVGREGTVFNFEPLPENLEEINYNFQINGINNYINISKAVTDKGGVIEFTLALHNK